MEYSAYILYSPSTNHFYIGSTKDLNRRVIIHNSGGYQGSSTHFTNDWQVYFQIVCGSREQAVQIEKHIKRMRNQTYYRNLKQFPEIASKLLEKYK